MKDSTTHPRSATIHCEIRSSSPAQLAGLAQIAGTCAADLGQRLELNPCAPESRKRESTITLHVSAEQTASDPDVWCLACRLACFCYEARVSVLVHGAEFNSQQRTDEAHPDDTEATRIAS